MTFAGLLLAAAVALAPAVALAAGPAVAPAWAGYYTDGERGYEVVVVGLRAWIFGKGGPWASPFVSDKSGRSVALPGANATLERGVGARGEWTLVQGGARRIKRPDPLLPLVREKLLGEQSFVLLDDHGQPHATHRLVLTDGLGAHFDLPDGRGQARCSAGVLTYDPTRNREVPNPPAAAAPKRGAITPRSFLMLTRQIDDCRAPLDAADRVHGLLGALVFASADGRVLGVQLTGYMMSVIYVRPGLSAAELQQLLASNRAAIERQAE